MTKQFLDASGLNQYTQALKNGDLKVGKSQDSSTSFYASHADATGLIGKIPLSNLPEGALERIIQVANKAARLALTSDQVQLGDTVQELDTKNMFIVINDSALGTENAFVEYTAGRASFAQDASHADVATEAVDASHAVKADSADKVEWNNVANKPKNFTPSAHTHGAADVSTLTGYQKASQNADVNATDSLLIALGKIEKKADDAAAEAADHTHTSDKIVGMTGYTKGSSYTPINTSDTLNVAIGKLEKLAVDSSVWNGIGGKPTEFTPKAHDGAKVTSLNTYTKGGNTGDIQKTDSLVVALAKLENKAEAGANERIPNETIAAIVSGSYKPTV